MEKITLNFQIVISNIGGVNQDFLNVEFVSDPIQKSNWHLSPGGI
jgi:hypothetical protein